MIAVLRRDLAALSDDWEVIVGKAVRWLGTVTTDPEALITIAAAAAL